jgi:hypothetical protein
MSDWKPLRFDPGTGGFKGFQGDDTLWLDYTDALGNIVDIQRSTASVFKLDNAGLANIDPTSNVGGPSLTVRGDFSDGTGILKLYDNNVGGDISIFTKTTVGSSWAFDQISEAPNHADAIGFRFIHKTENDTPLGDVLSLYNTTTASANNPLFHWTNTGAFHLDEGSGADILWGTDGAGNIGGSADNRPANIFAELTINGAGTVIKENALDLGPIAATNKTITALQTGTDDPKIRFNNATTKWELTNNGTAWSAIPDSWDALYALDKTLNIDSTVLTFTQTTTAGTGFRVSRNQATSDAATMIVSNAHVDDDQPSLQVTSAGQVGFDANVTGYSHSSGEYANRISFAPSTAIASGTISNLLISTTSNGNANFVGIGLSRGGGGSGTKYGINIDGNWTWGLWSTSPVGITRSLTVAVDTQAMSSSFTSNGSTATAKAAPYKAIFNGNASDTSDFQALGLWVEGSATGSATKYGVYVDTNWDYGLYSIADCYMNGVEAKSAEVLIGPVGLTDKEITAYQDGTDDPKIQYQNSSTKWRFTNDGTTWNDMLNTWDQIYAGDKSLTIDSTVLTFTQTSTTGTGFAVTRNQGTSNAAIMVVSNTNVSDAQNVLELSSVGRNVFKSTCTGTPVSLDRAHEFTYAPASPLASGSVYNIYVDTTCNGNANYRGIYLNKSGSGSGFAGVEVGTGWTYGLRSSSPSYLTGSGNVNSDRFVLWSYYLSTASSVAATLSINKSQWDGGAGDTSNCKVHAFEAKSDTDGAATKRGFYCDENWTRGLYSLSPIEVTTTTTVATEACILDQNDEDQAFVSYLGSSPIPSTYDSTKNLTSWQGGAGAVVGPKGQSAAESAWAWGGMIRTIVNGSLVWIPYYTYVP